MTVCFFFVSLQWKVCCGLFHWVPNPINTQCWPLTRALTNIRVLFILSFLCLKRVKNSRSLHRTFNVEPLYLQHENTGLAIDYMVTENFIKPYLTEQKYLALASPAKQEIPSPETLVCPSKLWNFRTSEDDPRKCKTCTKIWGIGSLRQQIRDPSGSTHGPNCVPTPWRMRHDRETFEETQLKVNF